MKTKLIMTKIKLKKTDESRIKYSLFTTTAYYKQKC